MIAPSPHEDTVRNQLLNSMNFHKQPLHKSETVEVTATSMMQRHSDFFDRHQLNLLDPILLHPSPRPCTLTTANTAALMATRQGGGTTLKTRFPVARKCRYLKSPIARKRRVLLEKVKNFGRVVVSRIEEDVEEEGAVHHFPLIEWPDDIADSTQDRPRPITKLSSSNSFTNTITLRQIPTRGKGCGGLTKSLAFTSRLDDFFSSPGNYDQQQFQKSILERLSSMRVSL